MTPGNRYNYKIDTSDTIASYVTKITAVKACLHFMKKFHIPNGRGYVPKYKETTAGLYVAP